jgi:hypothetical protein
MFATISLVHACILACTVTVVTVWWNNNTSSSRIVMIIDEQQQAAADSFESLIRKRRRDQQQQSRRSTKDWWFPLPTYNTPFLTFFVSLASIHRISSIYICSVGHWSSAAFGISFTYRSFGGLGLIWRFGSLLIWFVLWSLFLCYDPSQGALSHRSAAPALCAQQTADHIILFVCFQCFEL